MSKEMSEEDRAVRNSVFAATRAAETAKAEQTQRGQIDIDLPVAAVPLPSRGLVYPQGHPLHQVESVDIKAMTAKEEDILMNRTLVRRGTVITELIKSCLINRDIDVNDMISGDRNALMIAIRITGYGAEYTTKIDCPKCETKQDFSINLTALDIKELDPGKVAQVGPNEFRFVLPMSKRTVTFKFLTGREEERILQDMEAKKKVGIIQDNLITTRLMNSVVSVDGVTNRDQVVRFCSNMPARDSLALRKHIDTAEPGVNMVHEFTCSRGDCGHTEVIAVPMGPSFFWPGS